jgi:hypothetical protein
LLGVCQGGKEYLDKPPTTALKDGPYRGDAEGLRCRKDFGQ